MNSSRQGRWLLAIVATLLALQVPLCALACTDASGAVEVAASPQPASPPCHDEAPAPTSKGPQPAHAECGCDVASLTLLPASADIPTTAIALAPAPARVGITAGFQDRDARLPCRADLPPPDLLLLKSTLLL